MLFSFWFGRTVSYDVVDIFPDDHITVKNKCNVQFRCMDCLEDLNEGLIQSTDLICIDIDHRGFYEKDIMCLLHKYKYKGLVVIDNILISHAMKNFWEEIQLPKYIVTSVGHWTGTGIVVFDESRYNIRLS